MHKSSYHKPKLKKFNFIKFIKVTSIYFILFIALSGMIDYYAWMEFNFIWFFIISIGAALPLGYLHTKNNKHDNVDDIADRFL